MRKIKLLKSVLILILGISVIGSICVVSTSCEEKKSAVVPVTSVELNKSETTLGVDETETLTATVLPETATDKSITWTSSDTNVATVDSNGTITAIEKNKSDGWVFSIHHFLNFYLIDNVLISKFTN